MGMSDKPDKKAGGRLGGTRQGVGVDPVRPPSRIDPGKRLARTVKVGLVMPDAVERSSVAKALMQARCAVQIVTAVDDARESEVLIADVDDSSAFALVDAVRKSRGDIAVVAWTGRGAMVERGMSAIGFGRVVAFDRKSRLTDLVDAMERVI